MADDRIECVPSLATPKPLPRPEPLQKSVYNLDLTPEKRPKVSRNVKARSELSVPTLNSTTKIQLQIEKLKCKKKTAVSQTTSLISDPTIAQYSKSNVLKVTSDYHCCATVCVITNSQYRPSTYRSTLEYIVISCQQRCRLQEQLISIQYNYHTGSTSQQNLQQNQTLLTCIL